MIAASEAQGARFETCVSAESSVGIVGLRTKPPPAQETALGCSLFRLTPSRSCNSDLCCCYEGEASRLKRPECSTRRKSSTRIRELREWKRTKASLLCSEHDAHLITGDVAMLTSMKLGLATTVAALSIAAVTSAGAAVNLTSAGETVGQAVARVQSRTPDAQPTQCWITADDNDHGTFGYWGSCSSPNASAAPAPASPAFEMQAQARRKCEED